MCIRDRSRHRITFDKQRNRTANISFSYARALSNRLSARQSLPARGGSALTWRASCSSAVLGSAEGSALSRRACLGPSWPAPGPAGRPRARRAYPGPGGPASGPAGLPRARRARCGPAARPGIQKPCRAGPECISARVWLPLKSPQNSLTFSGFSRSF